MACSQAQPFHMKNVTKLSFFVVSFYTFLRPRPVSRRPLAVARHERQLGLAIIDITPRKAFILEPCRHCSHFRDDTANEHIKCKVECRG